LAGALGGHGEALVVMDVDEGIFGARFGVGGDDKGGFRGVFANVQARV
jgi:hypothetical protein